MFEYFESFAVWCEIIIELIGVFVIAAWSLCAVIRALERLIKKKKKGLVYHELRLSLARGALLGLEFLIAADIISTVVVDLTFKKIGVLTIVILIRTFLSVTLEVEVNSRWPWKERKQQSS